MKTMKELNINEMEMVNGGTEEYVIVKPENPDEFDRLEPKAFGIRV